MKTTLNIDDTLMRRLQEEAARRGTTVSSLVEAGIRLVLDERAEAETERARTKLPIWRSGGLLVDVSNRDELYRVMEEEQARRPHEA